MLSRVFIILCCLAFAKAVSAQEESSVYKPIYDFSLLRQNDVISIKEPENLYQKLKHIPLGKKSNLNFGGSYRFQTEGFINEEFSNQEDQNNLWFLHRGMLHVHLKIADKFEFFGELNTSQIYSKANLSPVDKNLLSVNQLFVKYHFNPELNLSIGRQNMRLGSGRLVDYREGPNVRLSFDMLVLEYQKNSTITKAFHAVPVRQKEGVFDNSALDYQEYVSAVYWTQHWKENQSTDLYAIHKKEDQKIWNAGTADDNRVSLGIRHFGELKSIRFNNEFIYQLGNFGDQNISAWTASFNVEKDITVFSKALTLGLKTEAISGDNTSDNTLSTFDGLYPRGAYFGRVARFGPSNLIDMHPYVDFCLGPIHFELDYVTFWRFSKDDGLYGPPLNLQYEDSNDQRFIGHQIGLISSYEVNGFLAFELEGNLIEPGAFLRDDSLNDTLLHGVFTMELKF